MDNPAGNREDEPLRGHRLVLAVSDVAQTEASEDADVLFTLNCNFDNCPWTLTKSFSQFQDLNVRVRTQGVDVSAAFPARRRQAGRLVAQRQRSELNGWVSALSAVDGLPSTVEDLLRQFSDFSSHVQRKAPATTSMTTVTTSLSKSSGGATGSAGGRVSSWLRLSQKFGNPSGGNATTTSSKAPLIPRSQSEAEERNKEPAPPAPRERPRDGGRRESQSMPRAAVYGLGELRRQQERAAAATLSAMREEGITEDPAAAAAAAEPAATVGVVNQKGPNSDGVSSSVSTVQDTAVRDRDSNLSNSTPGGVGGDGAVVGEDKPERRERRVRSLPRELTDRFDGAARGPPSLHGVGPEWRRVAKLAGSAASQRPTPKSEKKSSQPPPQRVDSEDHRTQASAAMLTEKKDPAPSSVNAVADVATVTTAASSSSPPPSTPPPKTRERTSASLPRNLLDSAPASSPVSSSPDWSRVATSVAKVSPPKPKTKPPPSAEATLLPTERRQRMSKSLERYDASKSGGNNTQSLPPAFRNMVGAVAGSGAFRAALRPALAPTLAETTAAAAAAAVAVAASPSPPPPPVATSAPEVSAAGHGNDGSVGGLGGQGSSRLLSRLREKTQERAQSSSGDYTPEAAAAAAIATVTENLNTAQNVSSSSSSSGDGGGPFDLAEVRPRRVSSSVPRDLDVAAAALAHREGGEPAWKKALRARKKALASVSAFKSLSPGNTEGGGGGGGDGDLKKSSSDDQQESVVEKAADRKQGNVDVPPPSPLSSASSSASSIVPEVNPEVKRSRSSASVPRNMEQAAAVTVAAAGGAEPAWKKALRAKRQAVAVAALSRNKSAVISGEDQSSHGAFMELYGEQSRLDDVKEDESSIQSTADAGGGGGNGAVLGVGNTGKQQVRDDAAHAPTLHATGENGANTAGRDDDEASAGRRPRHSASLPRSLDQAVAAAAAEEEAAGSSSALAGGSSGAVEPAWKAALRTRRNHNAAPSSTSSSLVMMSGGGGGGGGGGERRTANRREGAQAVAAASSSSTASSGHPFRSPTSRRSTSMLRQAVMTTAAAAAFAATHRSSKEASSSSTKPPPSSPSSSSSSSSSTSSAPHRALLRFRSSSLSPSTPASPPSAVDPHLESDVAELLSGRRNRGLGGKQSDVEGPAEKLRRHITSERRRTSASATRPATATADETRYRRNNGGSCDNVSASDGSGRKSPSASTSLRELLLHHDMLQAAVSPTKGSNAKAYVEGKVDTFDWAESHANHDDDPGHDDDLGEESARKRQLGGRRAAATGQVSGAKASALFEEESEGDEEIEEAAAVTPVRTRTQHNSSRKTLSRRRSSDESECPSPDSSAMAASTGDTSRTDSPITPDSHTFGTSTSGDLDDPDDSSSSSHRRHHRHASQPRHPLDQTLESKPKPSTAHVKVGTAAVVPSDLIQRLQKLDRQESEEAQVVSVRDVLLSVDEVQHALSPDSSDQGGHRHHGLTRRAALSPDLPPTSFDERTKEFSTPVPSRAASRHASPDLPLTNPAKKEEQSVVSKWRAPQPSSARAARQALAAAVGGASASQSTGSPRPKLRAPAVAALLTRRGLLLAQDQQQRANLPVHIPPSPCAHAPSPRERPDDTGKEEDETTPLASSTNSPPFPSTASVSGLSSRSRSGDVVNSDGRSPGSSELDQAKLVAAMLLEDAAQRESRPGHIQYCT